jgi:hypothetical protein
MGLGAVRGAGCRLPAFAGTAPAHPHSVSWSASPPNRGTIHGWSTPCQIEACCTRDPLPRLRDQGVACTAGPHRRDVPDAPAT